MYSCECCGRAGEDHLMVSCCICNKMYKIDCVDLSKSEARKIHSRSGLTWTCKSCSKIGSDLNSLKAAIVALQNEIVELKTAGGLSGRTASTLTLLDHEKVIQEITERQKRSCNIIIYGCKENVADTKDEQIRKDTGFVGELLASMGVQGAELVPIRLGKFETRDAKIRPIKIKLASESTVTKILRNSRNLKSSDRWRQIYVFHDRTPMQLEIHRNARDELKRRLDGGESELSIKYKGGIPTIIPKKPEN